MTLSTQLSGTKTKEVKTNESDVSGKLFYRRVHRFQLPRLDSEFASDVIQSDRLFGSSSLYFVGFVLAPRFLSLRLAQDFCAKFAGFAFGKLGSDRDRCRGIFMQLKMFVLSGAAVALWLAPLVALDEKVSWHKSIQGLSLCGAVACAIGAGNIARRLAEENEIEAMKARAVKDDTEDEIAASVYVSQQQRQQEVEAILNPVEHLERALALTSGNSDESGTERSNQLVEPSTERSENGDAERSERIMQLRARGYGKAKIIFEIWGVNKGGSPKYKAAEAEYKRLVGDTQES
ncbi:hypothetical protein QT971_21020 [Microcoleus sp. herbarium19]|uniref:hypothetical protein n=1 Tax=unclassified Microcoleus TaxID=2642155 RepID=UPI002FD66CEE